MAPDYERVFPPLPPIMAARVEGWAGVRRMLARLVPTRAAAPWHAIVLVGFPAANFAATWILAPDALSRLPAWDRLLWLVPLTLVTDTGPLGRSSGGAASPCRACSAAGAL